MKLEGIRLIIHRTMTGSLANMRSSKFGAFPLYRENLKVDLNLFEEIKRTTMLEF